MINRVVLPYLLTIVVSTSALAGPLAPPAGPVSSTGRFGPRTEINQANTPGDADSLFKITQPGSYYLGGNITGVSGKSGIEIATSNMTLNLMGFSLQGVTGSLDGVRTSIVADNVTIGNGHVSGFGQDGVDLRHAGIGRGHHVEDVHSTRNAGSGLSTGDNSVILSCTSNLNGVYGFFVGSFSVIETSTAHQNGNDGFQIGAASTISHCTASLNTGIGIFASGATIITECAAYFSGEEGFSLGNGAFIENCTSALNSVHGIRLSANGYVIGNSCFLNGITGIGAGIVSDSFGSRIDGNYVSENDVGIDVNLPGNLVIRNAATRNTLDYDIIAGNDVGPIGFAATSMSPWANITY